MIEFVASSDTFCRQRRKQHKSCLPKHHFWGPILYLTPSHYLTLCSLSLNDAGIFIFAGTLIRTLGARNASRYLHSIFLANVLRCPMHFFDVTPLGRIVNRFSKDVDTIDDTVPNNANMFLMTLLHVVGTIIVISIGTPLFLSVIVPLLILYYLVQVFSPSCSLFF